MQTREDGVILEIDPNDELDTLNVTQRAEWQKQLQKNIPITTTTTEAPEVAAALGFDDEVGSNQFKKGKYYFYL